MKLTLGDKTYESDLRPLKEPSIGEARTIKRQTGLTLTAWDEGLRNLAQLDPDVLAGLVYLLRHRAGEVVDWAEIDALPLAALAGGLTFELTEGDKADLERERLARAADADADADADAEQVTDPDAQQTSDT